MKRTERQHLKDNELVNLATGARQLVEERKTQVFATAIAIIVILGGAIAYFGWRSHVGGLADALLAEATALDDAPVGPPPAPGSTVTGVRFNSAREKAQAQLTKFRTVAEDYPSTAAGMFARYREAATWVALGSPKEAVTAYQLVVDRAGNSFYGRMARLGLAEAQARTGQFDQAISIYSDMAQRKDDGVPIDGVLIQLGRTYRDAGKRTEAEQAFNRIIADYPGSPFSDEARRELEALKKS